MSDPGRDTDATTLLNGDVDGVVRGEVLSYGKKAQEHPDNCQATYGPFLERPGLSVWRRICYAIPGFSVQKTPLR
ncbi:MULTISPECIES: hypothetical protein [Prochlorococcus]|uniref:hypothetical protein n=1 Tax=Prochlorococcus TaxID=1218 RepID=UPI000AFC2800|nr:MULTISPECIES: hypothetical protein [Prochlorococcus]NMO83253.1 hypothetical protein [Prochlorococcus sp. P1344]NMP05107.1 hypothetical protein [Prochlorococcus sp. P1361]NMP12822.1 hypothetical protein [Prochlorococcus sp.P1363]